MNILLFTNEYPAIHKWIPLPRISSNNPIVPDTKPMNPMSNTPSTTKSTSLFFVYISRFWLSYFDNQDRLLTNAKIDFLISIQSLYKIDIQWKNESTRLNPQSIKSKIDFDNNIDHKLRFKNWRIVQWFPMEMGWPYDPDHTISKTKMRAELMNNNWQ